MIDKNTGIPYKKDMLITVVDVKRVKELIDAGVAVEIKETSKNQTSKDLSFYLSKNL